MEILNDKVLVVRTRNPQRVTGAIPKSRVIKETDGVHDVAVHWGFDESRVLTNLKFRGVPSTIKRDYTWTGKLTPFVHQIETASFLSLRRKAFCFSEQGTAKTASAIWAADYLMNIGEVKRVLVLCPLSIIKSVWQQELFRFAMHRSCGVAHGTYKSRVKTINSGAEFVVINFDGLAVVKKEIIAGKFDLIIVDECFAAGTPVATPTGYHPIETMLPGDEVLTSTGVMRIKRLVRNTSKQLVEVKTSDGQNIKCTPEHPFFTDAGWVTAANLKGRRLVHDHELSDMRKLIFSSHPSVEVAQSQGYADWDDLLTVLRSEETPHIEPGHELLFADTQTPTRVPEGHIAQSGISPEYVGIIDSQGTQADSTRGQRNGDDCGGETRERNLAPALGMELPRSVGEEAARLSYQLQTRLCQRENENRVRGGWEQPQYDQPQNTGPEKGSKTQGTWVDSVTYIECPSGESVYNLEVEGTPNYFVGSGILVHNCNAYKNVTTGRWKVLRDVSAKSRWMWMMTGTPAAQSPVDAYGLAKLVNPDGVPKFYGRFRDSVMYKISMYKWVPKSNAQDVVHAALQPAIRFERDQCLDLPDVLMTDREAPLTPQQQTVYNTIKKDMFIEAAGEDISAVNAAVKINKLLQISGGSVYTDSGEVVDFDVSKRLKVVLEVIQEASHKVLVFVPFTHTIELLRDFLTKHQISCDVINGKVPSNRRSDIVTAFQTNPDPHVLLIQPQAASHGLTLTAADTIIWYAPVTSVETYLQANARINRPGQKHSMNIVHIYGSEVEVKLYKMLQGNIVNHQRIIDLYRQEILGE